MSDSIADKVQDGNASPEEIQEAATAVVDGLGTILNAASVTIEAVKKDDKTENTNEPSEEAEVCSGKGRFQSDGLFFAYKIFILMFILINTGKRTEWSPIRSVIIRVITKSIC